MQGPTVQSTSYGKYEVQVLMPKDVFLENGGESNPDFINVLGPHHNYSVVYDRSFKQEEPLSGLLNESSSLYDDEVGRILAPSSSKSHCYVNLFVSEKGKLHAVESRFSDRSFDLIAIANEVKNEDPIYRDSSFLGSIALYRDGELPFLLHNLYRHIFAGYEDANWTCLYGAAPRDYPTSLGCTIPLTSTCGLVTSGTLFSLGHSLKLVDDAYLQNNFKFNLHYADKKIEKVNFHQILLATSNFTGKIYIIDPTYKQFLSAADPLNDGLPVVMAFELPENKDDLISILQKHKIPEAYHYYWFDAFDKARI